MSEVGRYRMEPLKSWFKSFESQEGFKGCLQIYRSYDTELKRGNCATLGFTQNVWLMTR